MSSEIVRTEEGDGVLTVWLNRPEKRNALNRALVEALSLTLASARARDEVRVLLLRGKGPDFCAGADLVELEGMLGQTREEGLADARRLGALLLSMRRHPKPIIAAVQGRALAGGCGLATACDMILARDDAELGYPEVRLGFVPAMVMAILRRKLTEGRAFDLVTSGNRITAEEALSIGLVSRVLPTAEFDEQVSAFAADLAERPSSALSLTKSLLYEQADLSVDEGIERGAQVNVQARETDACMDGIRAFLDRKRGSRR